MTDQADLLAKPEPPTHTINGHTFTTSVETMRIYNTVYDERFKKILKSQPRKYEDDERRRRAHVETKSVVMRPECVKNMSVCETITSYIKWTPGTIWSGRGWLEFEEERYFLIAICHACSGFLDGLDDGQDKDYNQKERRFAQLLEGPLTKAEIETYKKNYEKGYNAGIRKREKLIEEKGSDRYKPRNKKK